MDNSAQSQYFRTTVADTSEEMLSIQHKIWMKNSIEKRLEMTLLFIDSCRQLNMDGIKNAHSDWSESEIKKEYFTIIYADIFSKEKLNRILAALIK